MSNGLALREQYSTPQQQRDTAMLGMWTFLATEVLMFGGLFVSYAVYRMYYTQAFLEGSREMNLVIGTINTVILLTSSLTMSLAMVAIHHDNRFRCYWLLLLTMFLGMAFLVLKFIEYIEHYNNHKMPGIWFESSKPDASHVELFFVFYVLMTGLHTIHMAIGCGIVGIMAVRTALGRFSGYYHTAIDVTGLYWQFIDMIWTYLYVVLYLPGFH